MDVKFLIPILLLFWLASCTNQADTKGPAIGSKANQLQLPRIQPIATTLPLRLYELDWTPTDRAHIPQDVVREIEGVVTSYYFNECGGDSAESRFRVKDTYINTVQLARDSINVYLVLLKHRPAGFVNSRLIFYHNRLKKSIGKPIPYNLFARYQAEGESLVQTYLAKKLNLLAPEIEAADTLGRTGFRIYRLYHNGSSNALETTTITIGANSIDTVSTGREWITQ